MRFTIEQEFAAPPERVEAALVDPAYLERLSTLPKLGRPTLLERREDDGGVVRQSVRYAFVGDLNAAVRRVVDPKRLTWVEEATIDRRTHVTDWRIVPDHYGHLLRASGTFRLRPDADGGRTRRTAEGELKVSVPFVGGKVEAAIVSGLREHAVLEQDVLEAWLQDP